MPKRKPRPHDPPRLIAIVWLAVHDDGREELLPEHPGNIYAAKCSLYERWNGTRYLETSVDTRIYVETGDFIRLRGNWQCRSVYPSGVVHFRELGDLKWPT